MPFNASTFGALIQGDAFTLWHYRTPDTRATVTAAGYFASVATRLNPGDLLILQAADAMALLPLRANAALGTGVTLDGAVGPLAIARSVAHRLTVTQAAAAMVSSIMLAPFTAVVIAGAAIPASATVVGPISQVVFSLQNRDGVVIPPVYTRTVVGGQASASFAAPPIGTGYRIRVEDASDPQIGMTSSSFAVGPDLKLLLLEDGEVLLLEAGGALKQ